MSKNEEEFNYLNNRKSNNRSGFLNFLYYTILSIVYIIYFIVSFFCSVFEFIFYTLCVIALCKPTYKKRRF